MNKYEIIYSTAMAFIACSGYLIAYVGTLIILENI